LWNGLFPETAQPTSGRPKIYSAQQASVGLLAHPENHKVVDSYELDPGRPLVEHQGRIWSVVYGLAWLVGCSFEQFGCLGAACGLAGGVQIAPPSLAPEERKQNSFLAGLARGGRKGGSW
jgi:hypothetical protein